MSNRACSDKVISCDLSQGAEAADFWHKASTTLLYVNSVHELAHTLNFFKVVVHKEGLQCVMSTNLSKNTARHKLIVPSPL